MKKNKLVVNPSKWEIYRLRLMIIASFVVMLLFLKEVFHARAEYPVIYFMLLSTLLYSCARSLHEWAHYFYITIPSTPLSNKIYTVDIFTTFCAGEPYSMIEETLLSIVNISYPHKSYLCDESDDPYLKNLCRELGVIHVTRIEKKDAKAGNINNALRISDGELCVVLDPDHVPQPDFLDPIVTHFSNEQVGFVQIVQAYKNSGDSLVAKGAAQQTFQFYGPIMMTMNKYGTVLAIGANCTFRRKALESIGGHAAGLAEDMNTAMHLHAKGWKSVYVPQILARGLVPSTMSAYYAQQLKWSRGVFELLVTSYPKLFNGFTWRQKVHYATIPLYYLSGIIFLINFSIPVVCLLLDTSPINIDFLKFMIYAGPLALLSFLIRHFVQRWVMEEEERGFHIVGGLLMIGTWWIFLIGLYYTILRKKVPYNPTPKDGKEENNWKIHIPNICIMLISIFAIFYGLYNDWNPYNLIMSGFATLNCLIMFFSILAGRQAYFRSLKAKSNILDKSMNYVSEFKKKFWLVRRFIYRQVRNTALSITIVITGFMIFWSARGENPEKAHPDNYNKNILIPGIFAPVNNSGLSSVKQVKNIESKNNIHFGIVSVYLAWGDTEKCRFPDKILDSIYKNRAIPMVTWEPWQALFTKSKNTKEEAVELKVFKRILEHRYDEYLEKIAIQVRNLKKPIFIRFAHEVDNPQYPWSPEGENTAEEFKNAWRYMHQFFLEKNVNNVIWVWNPWKPEAINRYFPGKKYVDWIGITNLNYGRAANESYSMAQLYQPFHQNAIIRSGLPVMLAEMGTLNTKGDREKWFKSAGTSIQAKFPEIKAFVLFNSNTDYNLPVGLTGKALNWQIDDYSALDGLIHPNLKRNTWLQIESYSLGAKRTERNAANQINLLNQIRGINYKRGQNWSTNGNVLKKKDIRKDMSEIKQMGFNAIKIYGFSIYDDNILEVANEKKLNVAFSFWLPDNVSFINDYKKMDQYSNKVLETVKRRVENKNIIIWNIANSPLSGMRYNNFKPDLFFEQQAYFLWLNKLIKKIKEQDRHRPVSVNIQIDENILDDYQLLSRSVPAIDCIGLVENNQKHTDIEKLKGINFMSRITLNSYLRKKYPAKGVFLADWQDEKTTGYVSLDGIKDNSGETKIESYGLFSKWTGIKPPNAMPPFKILLPATTNWPYNTAIYNAIIYNKKHWSLIDDKLPFRYRWELVKFNQFDNPIQVTELGTQKQVKITIPENPSNYRIRLYITRDSVVAIVQSRLNIPLMAAPPLKSE